MKKVFLVHRWSGNPEADWYPWVKQKLEEKGFSVSALEMPNPDEPKIDEWVNFLSESVGQPDENTCFIGHSIGCQTIIRYLQSLDEKTKVAKAVLIAPWFNLNNLESEEEEKIAKPWIETPIEFEKVKSKTEFVCIFSDNDPFVPLSDKDIFRELLGAEIIVEHDKGHFTEDDGVTELPIVLDSLSDVDSLFE